MFFSKLSKGEWRRYSWSPSFTGFNYTTDDIKVIETTVHHLRNGISIANRPTTYVVVTGLVSSLNEPAGVVSELFHFEETKMPGLNATLVSMDRSPSTGEIEVFWSDNTSETFVNWDDLKVKATEYDTDPKHARRLLLLAHIRRDPNGDNLDLLAGSTCTIDGAAAHPVQFDFPD